MPMGMGEMRFDVLEKVLREYASRGLREVIPSTMGEPLLYTHFEKLCDLCIELHLLLNLTTNGTFPLRGVEYWATRLLPICRDIKVSLMGFTSATQAFLMPGIDPCEHRKNIERLVQVRDEFKRKNIRTGSVSLQVTVCKKNENEIQHIVNYALDLGVDRVKLNRAIFLDGCLSSFRNELALPVDAFFCGTARLPVEGTYIRKVQDLQSKENCPFLDQELWILPNGAFQRCPNPAIRFGRGLWDENSCQKCPIWDGSY